MGLYPANRSEWPHMSKVDDYFDARAKAQKLAARIIFLKEELAAFVEALSNTPSFAIQRLPQKWLSPEEIERLMNDAVDAFRDMGNLWNDLPDERRQNLEEFRL